MSSNHYDVIVIGTGAGGGTIAHALALAGQKILLLERGDFLPREKDNWNSAAVQGDKKYQTKEMWQDADGKEFNPQQHYYVGGNTKVYGAALFRMRAEDFGETRHSEGISPAWELSYAEFEPYYAAAEQLYGVRGNRGEDPTEPWSSSGYSYPAVSHEPRIQQLAEDFAAQGLKPFHMPLGIQRDNDDRLSKCIRCDTCDGYPCLVRAKSDAEVAALTPVLGRANVTLLTNALATNLETNSTGSEVTAVTVEKNGDRLKYTADVFVVSCGAINSAALLLRSANDKHPRGLANSSDLVGRHLMKHNNSIMLAVSRCEVKTVYQKTLGINDFYFASDAWEYPMGNISFVGSVDGTTLAAHAPAIVPGFSLEMVARRSLAFWLMSEDLPDPNNRVTLDGDGSIIVSYRENNTEAHERLKEKTKELMNRQRTCDVHGSSCHVGMFASHIHVSQKIPVAGVSHQNGTLRFGSDARTSVLDLDCRTHDVNNLYVVDGSFFPSSSALNPGLTIMANALRVGDHLLAGMK